MLNATVSESNSTELLQIDEGEYIAVADPVSEESFKSFDIRKGDRAGQKGLSLNVSWSINDEDGSIKAKIGRAPKVRQNIFLDLTSQGGLDFGKGRNVSLGQLREALGQNMTGRPWSFGMLGGGVAKIKVKHRILDDGRTVAEVQAVAKA
jgi:hypothetical protein